MRLAAALNIAKWWLVVAMLAGFFGALGWALGGPQTASVFVFCTLLAALAVYAYADRALLGMLGAREYALAEDPLLRSTVDALAAKIGVLPPKLYLIPDGYPRALAAGRGPTGSSIAFSTGLLGALTPAELEAVIAHELAHVRRRDVLTQTLCCHARGRPGRPLPDRRLVRAGAAGDSRPDRRRIRSPPALPEARARGGPDGVVGARLRRRARGRARSSSTAPATSSPSRRARRRSRSTPSIRSPRKAWRRSSSRTRRCRSGYCA